MLAPEATWEPVEAFRTAHLSFQLEDKLFPERGEMLWWARPIREGSADVARRWAHDERRSAGHDHHGDSAPPFQDPFSWFVRPLWFVRSLECFQESVSSVFGFSCKA
jgi:hypothetical protein